MTGLALEGAAVQELSASFGGDLVTPDDAHLRVLKDRYGPDNVFRLNQNIPPSGG